MGKIRSYSRKAGVERKMKVKFILKDEYEDDNWIPLARYRLHRHTSCGHSNKPSISINCMEFPLLRRPQEEVARIVRMSTLQILQHLRLFSIALQSGGISHQLKALVVSKGYQKGIIINITVNKARRL
jgi:hypothetical protein